MVSSLSLKLRDMLLEKGFQLLDIYRIHEKKGEEYMAIDELRVKDKQTGKVFLVKLDGPKEASDPEKIVNTVLEAAKKNQES
jgi:hypothetical protein